METIKQTRTLKYTYSQEETLGLSVDLANANNALVALENEKKTFTSQIGAQINEQKERISGLSQKVASGYEFREVECRVDFQTPTPATRPLPGWTPGNAGWKPCCPRTTTFSTSPTRNPGRKRTGRIKR